MKKTKKAIQTTTIRSVWLTFIVVGVMLLALKEPRSYAIGYLIGSLVSIVNFRLLSFSLIRAVKNSGKTATPVISFSYLLRYMIYGVVLVLSVHTDSVSFITVAAGLLVVKVVVMLGVSFQQLKV